LVRGAAARAGLPAGVCLYTMRHSWITQSLMDGMSTLEVARISGTSLAMIERHYGHLVMKAARDRLELVNLL
jgi:integrase